MPPTPVPAEIDEFLRQPNHAVVATLRPERLAAYRGHLVPSERAGRVLLNMEATRMRLAWMAHDGRVALSAIDPENFYRHISLLGRIVDIYDDADLVDIDRLARRYVGGPYPDRDARRVSAWMQADAYHGWDPVAYQTIGPQAQAGIPGGMSPKKPRHRR